MSDPGSGVSESFGLPGSVLSVLPSDPFDQLDLARKITSIAIATRVAKLEDEADRLRAQLAEQDDLVAELRAKIETLEAAMDDAVQQLKRAEEEKDSLVTENATLTNTINKLNRDVNKLEIFKKTLMQSLQEEEESPQVTAARIAPRVRVSANLSTGSLTEDEEPGLPTENSSAKTQLLETGNNIVEDGRLGFMQDKTQGLLGSLNTTPKLTPADSPKRGSATGSPTRLSKPMSPSRRHSIAFSSTRNVFEEKSSMFSSLPTGPRASISSPFDTTAQVGRARVDGKEFFRQVRSRLSYEQFTAFLANVKELNAHKQSKEETLQKADEIFGPDNKDLYNIFEGLVKRNLQ